jgi:hypothetical protein
VLGHYGREKEVQPVFFVGKNVAEIDRGIKTGGVLSK